MINHKLPNDSTMSSSNDSGAQRRKGWFDERSMSDSCLVKVRRKRIRKSVQFSPAVSLRCFYQVGGPGHALDDLAASSSSSSSSSALWMTREEVLHCRRRAKRLSKLHCQHMQSSAATANATTPEEIDLRPCSRARVDATRYTIRGESLRGLESYTDLSNTQKLRQIRQDAISTVLLCQEDNASGSSRSSSDGSLARVDTDGADQDEGSGSPTSKLASLYKDKSQDALLCATLVAQEDAKVAIEILKEDL